MTESRRSSKPIPGPTSDWSPIEESSHPLEPPVITCDPIKYPEGHSDCQFLDLPAELRISIYSAAFSGGGKNLALLQTCRQIHMESAIVLHQRPISFSSQSKLFSWIAETQSAELERVKAIKLCLTDIDLSSLFDPRPMADKRNGRSSSCWYLYSAELIRLDQALRAMTGLLELTIVPLERSTSLMRGLYLSFLEGIPMRCPRLKLLTIYDQDTLLQKVPELRRVPKVVFLDPEDLHSWIVPPAKHGSREREVYVKMEVD